MHRYSFHVAIQARPRDVRTGPVRILRGLELPTIVVPPEELGSGFDRTFEEVGELLSRFERLLFEPDGSFVWTSSASDQPWQLDGVLYDRNGRVLYVDLKGTCAAPSFEQLLTALGWPRTVVVFQLMHEAILLDEPTFRTYAAAATL